MHTKNGDQGVIFASRVRRLIFGNSYLRATYAQKGKETFIRGRQATPVVALLASMYVVRD
jgi:hypothetical protein